MTYPEGRKPITWADMDFADAPKGHPSTWRQEVEKLRRAARAAITFAENGSPQTAAKVLRDALGDDQ